MGSVTAMIFRIWTNVAKKILPGRMSLLHLEYVQKYLRNLPLKFFKIGPVTDKILLIWTNLARTNVTWTIVYLTMVLDCPE